MITINLITIKGILSEVKTTAVCFSNLIANQENVYKSIISKLQSGRSPGVERDKSLYERHLLNPVCKQMNFVTR